MMDNKGKEIIDCFEETDIEKKYVQETYDAIAPHFSLTRTKVWPFVEKYLNNLPHYSIVADIGCGNGKNVRS